MESISTTHWLEETHDEVDACRASLDFEMPDLKFGVSLSLLSAFDSGAVRLFTDNYSLPLGRVGR